MDIPPYLRRESSKVDEIWYTNTNFTAGDGNYKKKSEIRKFIMADGRGIKNHFSAITQLHVVPL